jgi:hypothetical protein
VEIGGGYGGQCLVYKEMQDVDYTVVDIPESLELSGAYLKANDIESTLISSESFKPIETDLLISDYCLSELTDEGIDFYLDNIKFKHGYFTCNGQFDYIESKLKSLGYKVTIKDEVPATSRHKNKVMYAVL